MLITKKKPKDNIFCCVLLFCFFLFVFLFVFSFDPGRGCLFSSAPLSSLVIPRKETTQRTILRQFTATGPFGCTRKFWTISDFTGKHSILWPQPRKFCKKSYKLRKFTSAVFAPHQKTAAQNTLRHQKPLFFPHFSATTAPRRPCSWKSKQKPQTHQVYFFRPDNRSTPKMQSNRQHQSRNFHQNHISTVHSSDCPKPLFL